MTITTLPTSLMTADELLRMPDDGYRRELIAGVLYTMSPDDIDHGFLGDNVHFALSAFARARKIGRVFENVGFILQDHPVTVLAPDVAFITRGNIPPRDQRTGFVRGRPGLAVEVLSPSNGASEISRKTRIYLTFGVRLVWIVDPESRTVAVHSPDRTSVTLIEGDILSGGDVLPGFSMPVTDVFAELDD